MRTKRIGKYRFHSFDGLFPWTRASSLSILALMWTAGAYAAEEPKTDAEKNKALVTTGSIAELKSEVARLKTELSAPQEEWNKKSESTALQPANRCVFGSLHTGVRMSMFGAPIARQANNGSRT